MARYIPRYITVAVREVFGGPTPWASGQESLKGLIFDTCEEAIQAIFPETSFVKCTERGQWGLE